MKYSESEIINALKIIKEVCIESKACKHCPLFTNDVCGVVKNKDKSIVFPYEWQIVGDTPKSLFLH